MHYIELPYALTAFDLAPFERDAFRHGRLCLAAEEPVAGGADDRFVCPSSRPVPRLSRVTHHAPAALPSLEPARPPQPPTRHAIPHETRNTQHESVRPPPQQHHRPPRPIAAQRSTPSCWKTPCSTPPDPRPVHSRSTPRPGRSRQLTSSRPAGRLTTPSAPCCKPPGPSSSPTSRTTPIWSAPRRPSRSSCGRARGRRPFCPTNPITSSSRRC